MAKLTREDVERIVREAKGRGERPNLRGVDLENVDLSVTLVSTTGIPGIEVDRMDLFGVNLSGANLAEAKLGGVDLREVDLSGADLDVADLGNAYLDSANLCNARLVGANLINASLNDTGFSGAELGFTSLLNLDLRQVKGLETVNHRGPSHIDTHTLQRSQGQIPEIFLRGCGLSDVQIQYAKLHDPNLTESQITDITYKTHEILTGPAIKYASCFISYAGQDEAFAQKLYNDLQNNGVRCWFAPEELKGSQELFPQIDRAIQFHDRLLLILSEKSLKSDWIMVEIGRAWIHDTQDGRSRDRRFFPIRLCDMDLINAWQYDDRHLEEKFANYLKSRNDALMTFTDEFGDDENPADILQRYFIPDFSNWQDQETYQRGFERLLQDLRGA